MRGHLDVRHVLGDLAEAGLLGVLRTGKAREHDLLVGVLVVDHEQAVLGAALDREEADEVVVVAELLLLRGGGLRVHVEGGRARQDGIAPADQHVGAVARRDVVGLVDAGLDLGEAEGGLGRRGLGAATGGKGQGRHGRRHGGDRERVPQQIAPVVAGGDHVAHGGVGAGIAADVLGLLERLRTAHGRLVHVHASLLDGGGSGRSPPERPVVERRVYRDCDRSKAAANTIAPAWRRPNRGVALPLQLQHALLVCERSSPRSQYGGTQQ